jgi:hypothetical protein
MEMEMDERSERSESVSVRQVDHRYHRHISLAVAVSPCTAVPSLAVAGRPSQNHHRCSSS